MDTNSWVFSAPLHNNCVLSHHFFCSCTHQFLHTTTHKNIDIDDIKCLACGNDYFKDVYEFENFTGTKIWKHFSWKSAGFETPDAWHVELKYFVPEYFEEEGEVRLSEKILMRASLKKDGLSHVKIESLSSFVPRYSLYADETLKPLHMLLIEDAKKELATYIMADKTSAIAWINDADIQKFKLDEQLKCLQFFAKNHYFR